LNGPTRGQVTKPLGLFNLMMNDEVNILTGNGLGGGSLINASIALRPHREVFEQSRWPLALRNVEVLGPYYDAMARSMSLSRTPFDQTPKVRLRRLAAARLSNNPNFFDRSNLSVMYDHRYLDQSMRNPQGMIQRACTLCGDCINGCNIGAKCTRKSKSPRSKKRTVSIESTWSTLTTSTEESLGIRLVLTARWLS